MHKNIQAFVLGAVVCLGGAQDPKVDFAGARPAFTVDGERWPSSSRTKDAGVDRVVIHSTFAKALPRARWFGRDEVFAVWRAQRDESGSRFLSTHYFVDRAGGIHQLVPETVVAHHAKGFNHRSIGIELAGIADEFVKEARKNGATEQDLDYTPAQYSALDRLLEHVRATRPQIKAIRHSDIWEADAAGEYKARKSDPGARFDPAKLSNAIEWTTAHAGK